jgi:hypothetical protein
MLATRWRWPAIGAAVLLAAALAAAFASARRDGDSDQARAACIDAKRAEARYVVVRDAYERGLLGPRVQVRRSVDPRAAAVLFQPDGRLRAWEGMPAPARKELLDWAASDPVYAKTGPAQERAAQSARRDCLSS